MDKSFLAFRMQNTKIYSNCPSVDCSQMYRVNQLFHKCDMCQKLLCIPCSRTLEKAIELHEGTCQTYQQKYNLVDVRQVLGDAYGTCPNCKIRVEKPSGCNHMYCKPPYGCDSHFCWNCLQLKSGSQSNCTCGNTTDQVSRLNCQYVYHHMDYCRGRNN